MRGASRNRSPTPPLGIGRRETAESGMKLSVSHRPDCVWPLADAGKERVVAADVGALLDVDAAVLVGELPEQSPGADGDPVDSRVSGSVETPPRTRPIRIPSLRVWESPISPIDRGSSRPGRRTSSLHPSNGERAADVLSVPEGEPLIRPLARHSGDPRSLRPEPVESDWVRSRPRFRRPNPLSVPNFRVSVEIIK